jgi:hypothetical protein
MYHVEEEKHKHGRGNGRETKRDAPSDGGAHDKRAVRPIQRPAEISCEGQRKNNRVSFVRLLTFVMSK